MIIVIYIRHLNFEINKHLLVKVACVDHIRIVLTVSLYFDLYFVLVVVQNDNYVLFLRHG